MTVTRTELGRARRARRTVYLLRTEAKPDANPPTRTVPDVSARRTRSRRPILRWLFAVPLVALLVADLAGCGSSGTKSGAGAAAKTANDVSEAGDIPDTQAFVPFTYPAGRIMVKVPEGWAGSETAGTVRFADRFNAVELSSTNRPSAPTVASATQDEVPALRASVPGFASPNVSTVIRPAGPVVVVTYQADSPKDAVTGASRRLTVERYEYWKDGTETIVTVSAPIGADNVDPWKTVTGSVAWT